MGVGDGVLRRRKEFSGKKGRETIELLERDHRLLLKRHLGLKEGCGVGDGVFGV